ncbi:hypothetical protein Aperf_G00000005145 [Anoplocephala perfoliata]
MGNQRSLAEDLEGMEIPGKPRQEDAPLEQPGMENSGDKPSHDDEGPQKIRDEHDHVSDFHDLKEEGDKESQHEFDNRRPPKFEVEEDCEEHDRYERPSWRHKEYFDDDDEDGDDEDDDFWSGGRNYRRRRPSATRRQDTEVENGDWEDDED